MRIVPKPWGEEQRIYLSDQVDAWVMRFKQGEETSRHYHPNKDKILIVLNGIAMMMRNGRWEGPFYQFESQRVPRGIEHQQRAITDCEILEIESPPDKQDIVRLEDKYGRQGQRYEDPEA